MTAMAAMDYSHLADPDYLAPIFAVGAADMDRDYGGHEGLRFGYGAGDSRGGLEVAMLDKDLLLILNHCQHYPKQAGRQIVGDGGWMHIQFLVKGGGCESLGDGGPMFDTPEGGCIITSYADDAIVEREGTATAVRKSACLYMRPAMMERFFRVSAQAVPDDLRWLVGGADRNPRLSISPLHPIATAAVNDMLSCGFRSHARTAYLQAKSAELVATVLDSLNQPGRYDRNNGMNARDIDAIAAARRIMDAHPCGRMSLDQLAARVGTNRTKLAAGFKLIFGETVQGYWRDRRLALAQDLLKAERRTVTEVAIMTGYSEIASFTRAFTTRFGMSPKQVRAGSPPPTLMQGALTGRP